MKARELNKLPLEGIRVADFSQVFAGPAATVWLSLMGAEVIKIENPARPDTIRGLSRGKDGKFVFSRDPRITYFATLNYNKKSCTLNMKHPRARQIAGDIVRISDVVAENFANGVMDRFGLGYEDVRRLRPDIVMLSISGFGHTGPCKDYVAYASIATAYAGLSALTGYEGGHPEPLGGGWGDLLSAKFAAFTLLAALERRRQTGQSTYVDMSMTQVMANLIPDALMDFSMNGRNQGPRGNRDNAGATPHNVFPCKGNDSWAVVTANNNHEWAALCDAIGKPSWKNDPRFGDAFARSQHESEIDQVIAAWTSQHMQNEVMETLQAAGVPAARSSTIVDLAQDPHLAARNRYVTTADYRLGTVTDLRLPGTSPENSRYGPAPAPGEHNRYVLGELLGMTEADIRQLEEEDIILKV